MGSIDSTSNKDKSHASVKSSPTNLNRYSPRIEAMHVPIRPSDPSPMIRPPEPMRVSNPSPMNNSQEFIAPPMARAREPMRP